MGFTNNWKVVSNFLDHHIKRKMQIIAKETSAIASVTFLLDNVNVIEAKRNTTYYSSTFGPKMWNFTGRGILIPNIQEKGKRHNSAPSRGFIVRSCYGRKHYY